MVSEALSGLEEALNTLVAAKVDAYVDENLEKIFEEAADEAIGNKAEKAIEGVVDDYDFDKEIDEAVGAYDFEPSIHQAILASDLTSIVRDTTADAIGDANIPAIVKREIEKIANDPAWQAKIARALVSDIWKNIKAGVRAKLGQLRDRAKSRLCSILDFGAQILSVLNKRVW